MIWIYLYCWLRSVYCRWVYFDIWCFPVLILDACVFNKLRIDILSFWEFRTFFILRFIKIWVEFRHLVGLHWIVVVSFRYGAILVKFATSDAAFFLLADWSLLCNWRPTTAFNAALFDWLDCLWITYYFCWVDSLCIFLFLKGPFIIRFFDCSELTGGINNF
jgi:hypothetical protein